MEQDEVGLNLYDMELRDYDPAIGRWTGIDPVTHHSQSTYMLLMGILGVLQTRVAETVLVQVPEVKISLRYLEW